MELFKVVEQSFYEYAGETIYNRALVDVRDGLKPSARLGLYAQYIDKILSTKPYQKSIKSVSSAMGHFYVHGDTSMYNLLMRMGKPFIYRYPLEDIQGTVGNLNEADNHAASRYTEMRLSPLGEQLFNMIEEETIERWFLNYSGDEYFPEVLPSAGFWGICNGAVGIASGLSCSIPQFNLREMNSALIAMLKGAVYELPMPDFATGGTLLNTEEVKESLLAGSGSSCKLRAKMKYDEKKRTFTVYEIPYSTYTNTICKELEQLMEEENSPIETFIDLTGEKANIQIKIKKKADPTEVRNLLYSKTSLQNFYGINLTMLDQGRYPKVFTLPEAMQAHLNHEKEVYYRSYEFRLKKILFRIHILRGYILACANIEEVVRIIKGSQDRKDAKVQLIKNFDLDEDQAEAILKLTLSRIASLEAQKFIDEKEELKKKVLEIEAILNSEELLNQEIIKGLERVSQKYGENRKTELLNVEEEVANKLYYFTADGKVGLSAPKEGIVVGTLPAGQDYLVVTKGGIILNSNEQPKRLKQVFKLTEGDSITAVFPNDKNKYLSLISSEGNFRSRAVASLNKNKTTINLKDIAEVYMTTEKTSKTNYKQIVERENIK